jgi:hypothetical protein
MKFVYQTNFYKKINKFPESPGYGNYKPEIAGLTLKKDCLNFSDTLAKAGIPSFEYLMLLPQIYSCIVQLEIKDQLFIFQKNTSYSSEIFLI